MARGGRLPRSLGQVDAGTKVPTRAMLLVAGVSPVIGVAGAEAQELLTTLVTFGALTASILLHVAVIAHFGVRRGSRQVLLHWASPVTGIAVLGCALWSAISHAKVIGVLWLFTGAGIAGWFHLGQRRDHAPARVERQAAHPPPPRWPTAARTPAAAHGRAEVRRPARPRQVASTLALVVSAAAASSASSACRRASRSRCGTTV